jgi:hypothetical protein
VTSYTFPVKSRQRFTMAMASGGFLPCTMIQQLSALLCVATSASLIIAFDIVGGPEGGDGAGYIGSYARIWLSFGESATWHQNTGLIVLTIEDGFERWTFVTESPVLWRNWRPSAA